MTRYASQTSVSVERTRGEILSILTRYGANTFGYGQSGGQAFVAFQMRGRGIRMTLELPEKKEFRLSPGGRRYRNEQQTEAAWEQACRSSWRALLLVIRAKLEAVSAGISTVEDEFLAWTVLPGGDTVGQRLAPQLADALANGAAPLLLTGGVQ